MPSRLSLRNYQELAEFRYSLRRFLQFSEQRARDHQMEPQQHQALLALKGLPAGVQPTVRELAGRLMLRHHSTVELLDRLQSAGFVKRIADPRDKRQTLIRLTSKGTSILRSLSLVHQEELRVKGPELIRALQAILRAGSRGGTR